MTDTPLTPIAPERVAQELRRIIRMRDAGELDQDAYEHRFARMVGELRDRRIAGTRADILQAIGPLRHEAGMDPAAWDRLVASLGL